MQSSLCYPVGPCWLFILNVTVGTHPSLTLTIPSFLPPPATNLKLILEVWESVSVPQTVSKAHLLISSPTLWVHSFECHIAVTASQSVGFSSSRVWV